MSVPNYTEQRFTHVITAPGPFSFVLPPGNVRASLESLAGGSAGGNYTNQNGQNYSGGGGGGGAYAMRNEFAAIEGDIATGIVGAGGPTGPDGIYGGTDGAPGNASWVQLNGVFCYAIPGVGGKANGAGGLGGPAASCVGDAATSGGKGGDGTPNNYAGGGGAPGKPTGNGNNGTNIYGGNPGGGNASQDQWLPAQGGWAPGGGGAGAYRLTACSDHGGAGKDGEVRISYVVRTYI